MLAFRAKINATNVINGPNASADFKKCKRFDYDDFTQNFAVKGTQFKKKTLEVKMFLLTGRPTGVPIISYRKHFIVYRLTFIDTNWRMTTLFRVPSL